MVNSPHPSIRRIAHIARSLSDMSRDVVFNGGAVAPLLQSRPVLNRIRPTHNVDAIIASTNYTDHHALEAPMCELHFTTDDADARHVYRWRSPDGTAFDLVPVGGHLGASGSRWDRVAIRSAVETEVAPGVNIQHVNAPGFLALRWDAFRDRGDEHPYSSVDLEDIIALLASREEIVNEFSASPADLQDYIRSELTWLKNNNEYDDLLAVHLGGGQEYARVAGIVKARIEEMT